METLPAPKLPSRTHELLGLIAGILFAGVFLYFFYFLISGIIKNINELSPQGEDSEAEITLSQESYPHTFGNLVNTTQPKVTQSAKPTPNRSTGQTADSLPSKTVVKDTKPPFINDSFQVHASTDKATLSWTTDEPATSQVEYGTDANYGRRSPLNSQPVTNHIIDLSNLSPGNKYYFRMLCVDASGNLATSNGYTFDTPAPSSSGSGSVGTTPTQPSSPTSRLDSPVTKKVMALIFNPIIESQGGKKLTEVKGWNDPVSLDSTYINDIRAVSGGYVNYQITVSQEIDDVPTKTDGSRYTDQTYLDCLSNSATCHNPDGVDYLKILAEYGVCDKRNNGEIDELWVWGGPYFGYYESMLAGPGAFWYNAPPLGGSTCNKQLPIMGFNYERGVSEMIEDMGHRTESVMRQVYGSWEAQLTHAWNRFTLLDKDKPGEAACGNIHFGPNSTSDYDWSNIRTVSSNCEDWPNYPNLTGATEQFNCSRWGCDGYSYKKWWFAHLPRYSGKTDGKWNNWWRYILDYEDSIN